jgi:hypothetical protein
MTLPGDATGQSDTYYTAPGPIAPMGFRTTVSAR